MTDVKPLQLTIDRPLDEQLGCFGYFGFGTGVAMALFGPANDTGVGYCNRCAQREACWPRHRARVRQLFPDLTALADEIAATHTGAAYFHEFMRRTEQRDPTQMTEPYVAVMMGNMEDGSHVATTQRPKLRDTMTLTWPLEPLS